MTGQVGRVLLVGYLAAATPSAPPSSTAAGKPSRSPVPGTVIDQLAVQRDGDRFTLVLAKQGNSKNGDSNWIVAVTRTREDGAEELVGQASYSSVEQPVIVGRPGARSGILGWQGRDINDDGKPEFFVQTMNGGSQAGSHVISVFSTADPTLPIVFAGPIEEIRTVLVTEQASDDLAEGKSESERDSVTRVFGWSRKKKKFLEEAPVDATAAKVVGVVRKDEHGNFCRDGRVQPLGAALVSLAMGESEHSLDGCPLSLAGMRVAGEKKDGTLVMFFQTNATGQLFCTAVLKGRHFAAGAMLMDGEVVFKRMSRVDVQGSMVAVPDFVERR